MFNKIQTAQMFTRSLLGLFVVVAAGLALPTDASARALYVSPSGDGTTGQNWKTAWKDPAQIDWKVVAAGDQILIDGGTAGITYTTSFTVPVSNIVIRQASGAAHNGTVTFTGFTGQSAVPYGIKFVGSNVHLVANKRAGIKLTRYGAQCLDIQSSYNSVRNVEMSYIMGFPPYLGGRVGGVTFGGANNHFIGCDFRDCTVGAVERPLPGVANSTVFNNCTFGANGYGFFGNCGAGIVGAKTVGGPATTIFANKCVFGPYVDYGVDVANGTTRLSNSLFLAARVSNIKAAPPAGSSATVTAVNCTLYEKRLDPLQQSAFIVPGYTISVNANAKLKVKDSIVWGGFVDVPATQVITGGGNVQFAVSGNTMALAPSMVDPNFVDTATLSAMQAKSQFIPRTLTSANFSPALGSPATGKGSPFVRVSDLVAPYGPTSGLPSAIGGP